MAKKKQSSKLLIPIAAVQGRILLLRGHNVMLDRDLAELYGVATKALNQAVTRNIDRFPEDFMFQLTQNEADALLRSQIVTLEKSSHFRYLPRVYTEHGALMLSAVLKSDVAVDVSTQVMRAFVKLRQMLASHDDLRRKLLTMERKYDDQFKVVFDAIRQLIEEPVPKQGKLGFRS